LKVLDPVCGTGNFLYVALQQLKVLAGEVLDEATKFGESFRFEMEPSTIDPHQFLRLEIVTMHVVFKYLFNSNHRWTQIEQTPTKETTDGVNSLNREFQGALR
jgi:type II restriction/modification system DNA methylase subunit YeeA